MVEKILCNEPTHLIVAGRNEEGQLVYTPEWLHTCENTQVNYLSARAGILKDADPFNCIHSIIGHQSAGENKCLLFITTNVAPAPGYALSFFYNLSGGGSSSCLKLITRINSPGPGVVIGTGHSRMSNLRTAFQTALKSTFSNGADHLKQATDTLTSKHASQHDISHLVFHLVNAGKFAPSRIPSLITRIKNEADLNGGFVSLFCVISALYIESLNNTGPARSRRKFDELRDSINIYLRNVPDHEPTILSTNGLPDDFRL